MSSSTIDDDILSALFIVYNNSIADLLYLFDDILFKYNDLQEPYGSSKCLFVSDYLFKISLHLDGEYLHLNILLFILVVSSSVSSLFL